VNPILSRKNMFSDFGFGTFYNELAVFKPLFSHIILLKMKILDIAKRK